MYKDHINNILMPEIKTSSLTQAVLRPAENQNVSLQLLHISAAIIIFIIRLCEM